MTPNQLRNMVLTEGHAAAYGHMMAVSLGLGLEEKHIYANAMRGIDLRWRYNIIMYVAFGQAVDDVLIEILRNDLMEVMEKSHPGDALAVHGLCRFLRSFAPHNCFGSAEKVGEWIKMGGIFGWRPLPDP